VNIIEAIGDPKLFRPLFKDPSTWRAWEVYLRALFGLRIEEKRDLKLLRAAAGLRRAPASPTKESFVIAGRRSGKSFISSIIAVYLACFKDWRPYLSRGERGFVFIIANDRLQARIIKDYVSGIMTGSPVLRSMVTSDLKETIELRNGVVISIKTASYRTLRGFTVLAAILEEVAFWRSEESANPDREIMAALRPALATIPESLLIGISTPYARSGVLYEQFKKYFGKPGPSLIWKARTTMMNPTIDARTIRKEMEEDPQAARSEWLAEFREDIEAFLPLELVESAVVPGRYELARSSCVSYSGFLDPSGGRSDSFTMAIAHRGQDGKIVLDALRERKPPFSPEAVVAEYAETLKAYGISRAESDRYAGEWPVEAFKKRGITVKASERTASELYLEFLPLISSGRVELLDSKRAVAQLTNLERRVRSGGKDLVTHFPGGHDDVANAVAGACALARRPAAGPRIRVLGDWESDSEAKAIEKSIAARRAEIERGAMSAEQKERALKELEDEKADLLRSHGIKAMIEKDERRYSGVLDRRWWD
jgi:hypothetical protein